MTVERIRQFLTAHGEKPLILGLIGVLFAATVIVGALANSNNAYAVFIDGQKAALVADKDEAKAVLDRLVAAKEAAIGQAVTTVQQVEINKVKAKGVKLTGQELEALLAGRLDFTTAGVAVLVNGQQVFVLESRQVAEKLIDETKRYHLRKKTDNVQVASMTVEEDISFKTVEIGIGEYYDYDTALNLLVNGTEKTERYQVSSGESLWTIARDHNLRIEDLRAANPWLKSDRIQIGDELNLVKQNPLINVVAVLTQSVKESIPFTTKFVNDSSLYRGQDRIVQAGQRGEREVVYQLVQKNGLTVEKKELEAKVLNKPVERVVNRGTKVIVASRGSGEAGKIGWPASGQITSPYGTRSGTFHSGIDIAAPLGTSIRAALAGTVTFVGWQGAYGNMIDIDHGNGVSTRYAHNSANLVTVGQEVNAGDIIARVGNTGRSTGPHVHFEVRINGQARNPLNYLP
jgi:murein DD-endopeptidase MepM/ murein hydrolase activator NlpD